MKLFAGAIVAASRSGMHFTPIAQLAQDKETAKVQALELCHKTYPARQGYFGQATDVVEVARPLLLIALRGMLDEPKEA